MSFNQEILGKIAIMDIQLQNGNLPVLPSASFSKHGTKCLNPQISSVIEFSFNFITSGVYCPVVILGSQG